MHLDHYEGTPLSLLLDTQILIFGYSGSHYGYSEVLLRIHCRPLSRLFRGIRAYSMVTLLILLGHLRGAPLDVTLRLLSWVSSRFLPEIILGLEL